MRVSCLGFALGGESGDAFPAGLGDLGAECGGVGADLLGREVGSGFAAAVEAVAAWVAVVGAQVELGDAGRCRRRVDGPVVPQTAAGESLARLASSAAMVQRRPTPGEPSEPVAAARTDPGCQPRRRGMPTGSLAERECGRVRTETMGSRMPRQGPIPGQAAADRPLGVAVDEDVRTVALRVLYAVKIVGASVQSREPVTRMRRGGVIADRPSMPSRDRARYGTGRYGWEVTQIDSSVL